MPPPFHIPAGSSHLTRRGHSLYNEMYSKEAARMTEKLPNEFRRRMDRLLEKEAPAFYAALTSPLHRGLRVNTLKCSIKTFRALFPEALTPVPFSPCGFEIQGEWKAGADPLHHAGAYYMQESSAMAPATVLSPRPGEWILDLCAAPGGKATGIAAALDGQGLLWANEIVGARAQILLQNIERCGVPNAVVSSAEPALLADRLGPVFDGVLVDAPCSGEGMFRKEPAALEQWSLDNIHLCAKRQRDILREAARLVRPGGRLLYSTCTFAPEENEGTIGAFLREHPEFSLADLDHAGFGRPGFSVSALAPFSLPGEEPFDGFPFERCRRILPQDGGEGHFLALLRREEGSAPSRPLYNEPKCDTIRISSQKLYEECFSNSPKGTFAAFGKTVRLLPPGLPDLRGLPVLGAGPAAADILVTGRGATRLEPSHGLFMAARAADCRKLLDLPLDDPRLYAFLRGEEIDAPGCSGWTAVAASGIVTGFGKASGGRLKNRYPKGLRLRT